jgi:hypothetical protein
LDDPVLLRRDRHLNIGETELNYEIIAVICLVGNDLTSAQSCNERRGLRNIVGFSWREDELNWISEGINARMNFCCSSASALSDGILKIPPFPPALCW